MEDIPKLIENLNNTNNEYLAQIANIIQNEVKEITPTLSILINELKSN